jgi:hypothetical protein
VYRIKGTAQLHSLLIAALDTGEGLFHGQADLTRGTGLPVAHWLGGLERRSGRKRNLNPCRELDSGHPTRILVILLPEVKERSILETKFNPYFLDLKGGSV